VAEPVEVLRAEDPMTAAGERLAEDLRRAMHESELVRLAIPGGSALAAAVTAHSILGADFERVQLTWVDERCVDAADPDSNRGAAERAGLLGPAHPPRRIVPLFVDGERADDAVARARDELRAVFDSAIDVALLGLGEDGHVASLFPGRFDRDADATVLRIDDSPKPPAERISLGWRMLATAQACVVAAAGEAKRVALDGVVAGDPRLPAVGLHGLVVISDLDLREVSSGAP
jgi:6-phosphogluconolactonase